MISGIQQIPRSTIEIEAKILYPSEPKVRLKQMVIKVESWLVGRAFEGRGLEAARSNSGQLDSQEYQVLLALSALVGPSQRARARDRDFARA